MARLLRYLPPKLRATHLVGQTPERQRFWVAALARMKELTQAEPTEPAPLKGRRRPR